MPAVKEIVAAGYRSLRHIRFPVDGLTVFIGGNGTGKTNLYRALELLQAAADGTLTRALAAEGGINEPETSLHPDLMEPLARLIVRAAQRTQVWLVTHSERLAAAIAAQGGVRPRIVVKRDGETWIEGLRLAGDFSDEDDD